MTADIYTIPSGETLYAGCNPPGPALPPWAPAPGTVVDISLNTLQSVKGSMSNTDISASTWSWSGAAWAPWWGTYGRMMGGCGGHGNGDKNFLWAYNADTRLFYIEKPFATVFTAADTYVADTVTGWMWGDAGATTMQVGEPFTSHFYAYQVALPPSAYPGAPNGWLFTPGRTSMPQAAQRATAQSHKFALGIATKWSLHGTPLPKATLHGAAIYDTLRNRVIGISENTANGSPVATQTYIDIATGASGTLTFGASVWGYYKVGAYHSAADCYMVARYVSGALALTVMDAVTRAVTNPTVTGTPPVETAEGAWDWVDEWGAWIYYPGSGNSIYTLKCVGDPRGNNWAWAKQTVTGTARAVVVNSGAQIPLNRLRYCAAAQCAYWFPHYTLPMQGFGVVAP